jgi:hypothetical protein
VNPPAIFKPTNRKPSAGNMLVPVQNGKTLAVTISTPDQQFLASLADGAVPIDPGTTSVQAMVTPLDPATLGPVPPGLVPDGNAYRLVVQEQPSGATVGKLNQPGDLVLTVPSPATTMLTSIDGKTWEQHPVTHNSSAGSSSAGIQFDQPGYFLAAGSPGSVPVGVAGTKSSTGKVVLLVVIVVAVAAILGLLPVLARRMRRPRPAPAPGGRVQPAKKAPGRPSSNARKRPPPKKRRR